MADEARASWLGRSGRRLRRTSMKTRQRLAATVILGGVTWLAVSASHWPFQDDPAAVTSVQRPSFWNYLLADRVTLGFVRLGIVALAVFLLLSTVALALAARWLKGFGTAGMAADDADLADALLE